MNFIIKISMFLTFFTSKAIAVEIYKCQTDKRTEIAMCGFFSNCIDTKTKKEFKRPFIHTYDYESNYTVLAFEEKLIVKRNWDKHEFIYEKNKRNYDFFIYKDNIRVFTTMGSFLLYKNHFYHEIENKPAKLIHSGKCEKE